MTGLIISILILVLFTVVNVYCCRKIYHKYHGKEVKEEELKNEGSQQKQTASKMAKQDIELSASEPIAASKEQSIEI